MKTILYQPLFINPQAYFVFPQLYHIEKGDSYIEPANITGQLIINDLTKVLTSTPTLNVVQDTNDRTPNKIVITESKTDILNIIENINTSTNDIVIKVTGVSEELKLFVQDINSVRQHISKDGVYKFTNNVYQFFGFGINKVISGINVVIEQLPTSILKDFSGNKHDAYLYGFKGKLNSGVGIYAQDFKKW